MIRAGSFLLLSGLVTLWGCQLGVSPVRTDETPGPVQLMLSADFTALSPSTYSTAGGSSTLLDRPRKVTVNLALPSSAAEVYVLFTNASSTAAAISLASVTSWRGLASDPPATPSIPWAQHTVPPKRLELNWTSSTLPTSTPPRTLVAGPSASPKSYVVGDQEAFVDSLPDPLPSTAPYSHQHTMTLRRINGPALGRTLLVWVADECWAGSSTSVGPRFAVTQGMVDALADRFHSTGGSNEVYRLVTSLFGAEWATSGAPVADDGFNYAGLLVDGGAQVHIVIANLNPGSMGFGGGIEGYFHDRNAFLDGGLNRKVMMVVDASNLANPDADGDESTTSDRGAWSLACYFPNQVLSSLAHELQHMIHYYQKQVRKRAGPTDVWINEMASEVTEDLVASQVGVVSPRGVSGADLTSGSASTVNWDGRIPLFNGMHDQLPLTTWSTVGGSILPEYSNAYVFGAWLTRNYGGVSLWRDFVQSSGTDVGALVAQVRAHGGAGESYATLVSRWGLAVLLGSGASQPGLSWNATDLPLVSANQTLTYQVGAINLYRYPQTLYSGGQESYFAQSAQDFNPVLGPRVHASPPGLFDSVAAGATWIYRIDSKMLSGSRTLFDVLALPPQLMVTYAVFSP